MTKRHVLIFAQHYVPGFKAGGPVRSIKNLVAKLNSEFKFTIITSDRDFGDDKPYSNVKVNQQIETSECDIYYLSSDKQSMSEMQNLINRIKPDVIYLNSLFGFRFSVQVAFLNRVGRIDCPMIVAPRGELGLGALKIKFLKKKLFLFFAKVFGLYKKIVWQATSNDEVLDIKRQFGSNIKFFQATNISSTCEINDKFPVKEQNALSLAFVSRISRKKQLDYALKVLSKVRYPMQMDIYGPLEDKEYWAECLSLINELPDFVTVNYIGVLAPEKVGSTLIKYDAFLLPTLNENFGHIIFEALLSGCVPIISDQCPWKDLKKHNAGWVISLSHQDKYIDSLEFLYLMDSDSHQNIRINARNYALKYLNKESTEIDKYRIAFSDVS